MQIFHLIACHLLSANEVNVVLPTIESYSYSSKSFQQYNNKIHKNHSTFRNSEKNALSHILFTLERFIRCDTKLLNYKPSCFGNCLLWRQIWLIWLLKFYVFSFGKKGEFKLRTHIARVDIEPRLFLPPKKKRLCLSIDSFICCNEGVFGIS